MMAKRTVVKRTVNNDAAPRSSNADHDGVLPKDDMRLLLDLLTREERDAKALLDAVAAENVALMEAELSATYDARAGIFTRVAARIHAFDAAKHAEWDRELEEINEEVKKILTEEGLPHTFAPTYYKPQLPVRWLRRGETEDKERRDELRRAGLARIKSDKAHALVEQQMSYTKVRRQIMSAALTTRQARRLIETIPTARQLLPPIKIDELEALVPFKPQNYDY